MKFFIYSFFLLLLAPCNGTKKTTSTNVNNHSEVIIIYQCTACFGRCPIYTLTIDGKTKTATYKGEQHVSKVGMYSKTISDEELNQLVDAFEKANFNSLDDQYLGSVTDFPSRYITYTNKEKTKKIQDRMGAPASLKTLEKTIEAFADTEGWKKTGDVDH